QRLCSNFLESESLRQRERLARLRRVVVAGEALEAGDLAQNTCFGRRGRLRPNQLLGPLEVLEDALSTALYPPELREHGIDFGGSRTVAGREQRSARVLEELTTLVVVAVEGRK